MNEESEYKEILCAMLTLSSRYFKGKMEEALKYALLGDVQKTMATTREAFDQLKSYATDIDDVARFVSDILWRKQYRTEYASFVRQADLKMSEILRIGMALQMTFPKYQDA